MSWQLADSPVWEEPITFASRFAGRDMAFLYSSLAETYSGNVSFLFVDVIETKTGSNWAELPPITDSETALPIWVGYLGFGLRDDDVLGGTSPVSLPDFRLIRYARLYRFDHEAQRINYYVWRENHDAVGTPSPLAGDFEREQGRLNVSLVLVEGDEGAAKLGAPLSLPPHPNPLPQGERESSARLQSLASNFTRREYESIVADTIEQIRNGNFYQANITRKFFGEFADAPDSWQLFTVLSSASPAPYSAYVRHGDSAILSSSPECFLTITADGMMTTRPIKGSARRSDDASTDKKIREQLLASPKNHAENLMIVDLMRNDLSRVSVPQSVEVVEQSVLHSYRTIHHLISTIRAKKLADVRAYDAVRACFPAGSMTGAPKIAAMNWCTQQEKLERGIYSGAIGWFGAQDTCDLSVVIRTLILDGKRFEFQVGGGVVADSTPEDEWRETITKARGILVALGLKETDLEKL